MTQIANGEIITPLDPHLALVRSVNPLEFIDREVMLSVEQNHAEMLAAAWWLGHIGTSIGERAGGGLEIDATGGKTSLGRRQISLVRNKTEGDGQHEIVITANSKGGVTILSRDTDFELEPVSVDCSRAAFRQRSFTAVTWKGNKGVVSAAFDCPVRRGRPVFDDEAFLLTMEDIAAFNVL